MCRKVSTLLKLGWVPGYPVSGYPVYGTQVPGLHVYPGTRVPGVPGTYCLVFSLPSTPSTGNWDCVIKYKKPQFHHNL
eukprot:2607319-Rhodomonas_salina.1